MSSMMFPFVCVFCSLLFVSAREKWNEIHGHLLNGTQQQQTQQNQTFQQTQQQPPQFTSSLQQQQYYQQQQQQQQSQLGASQSFNPNATGNSLPLAPSSIYDSAIRISSPRIQSECDDVNVPSNVHRRVIRQVEVPFTRQVKVPVMTRQLVPQLVEKKVRTKQLMEVPSTKMVTEEYTEVVQQPTIRNKEIWVKKLVPERFSQPIVVKKTRQVSVPTTVLRETDGWEVVQVTENRAVEVPGYRIDEVQDSKLVEVEELQNYALQPLSTGQAQILSAREVGPITGFHHSRRIGTEVYHPLDARHAGIEEDTAPFSGSLGRPLSSNGSRNNGTFRKSGQQAMLGAGNTAPARNPLGLSTDLDKSIGFKVRDGDANGVVVYRVTPGEAAERAGVRNGDVIIYVNNRPSRNLAEFRSVLNGSGGPVLLQVRRRGVQKLSLTVHR